MLSFMRLVHAIDSRGVQFERMNCIIECYMILLNYLHAAAGNRQDAPSERTCLLGETVSRRHTVSYWGSGIKHNQRCHVQKEDTNIEQLAAYRRNRRGKSNAVELSVHL